MGEGIDDGRDVHHLDGSVDVFPGDGAQQAVGERDLAALVVGPLAVAALLVVDDNLDTCEVLKQILTAAGATVRTVNSVRDGISELNKEPADIVLTDLAMPGESGLVFIEHIRNSGGGTSNLPVIVLSACAFDADKEAALKAGASLFVPKPFRPSEVVRSVRQLALSSAMQSNNNLKLATDARPAPGADQEGSSEQ